MKTSYFKIFFFLILFVISCKYQKHERNNEDQRFDMPELVVMDSVYLNQLKEIIFSNPCFDINSKEKFVFSIIYEPISKIINDSTLFFVSFSHYCDYKEEDLRNQYGGFYLERNGGYDLIVIKNTKLIPNGVYKRAGNTIDISKYNIGISEGSYAEWYIRDRGNNLELISFLCDGE